MESVECTSRLDEPRRTVMQRAIGRCCSSSFGLRKRKVGVSGAAGGLKEISALEQTPDKPYDPWHVAH